MTPLSFFRTVAVLLALVVSAPAQEDTAHHRAVYNEINKNVGTFRKVTGTRKVEDGTYTLTGWVDGQALRKIVAKSNTGAEEEIYLEGGKPLFVFSTYAKKNSATGKVLLTVEERLYFKEGRVFKWLTNDKSGPVLHSEDYDATTEMLNAHTAAFTATLMGKGAGKADASRVAEGTFTGIEEGDYFHWNMRDNNGGNLSFFIMKPDAGIQKVLDNPKAFTGRKCRVTWKKSREKIPEAGGMLDIEQVLSVEWLTKK